MSKFKKQQSNSTPKIATAALPDIIFMLLFFFMVVTTLRDASLMVEINEPEATELQKLEEKSLVMFFYLGRPMPQYQATYGTATRMQLNDKFAEISEIPLFIEQKKLTTDERKHPFLIASMKVDRRVTMGIVSDVKTKLRKVGQYRLNYSTKSRTDGLD